MHPVLAFREYTTPALLPMKRRPPTTVGWAKAITSLGKPNAHFNFSFGTSAAASSGLV